MIILPITSVIGSRWGAVGIAAGWVVIYPLIQFKLFSRIFRRINLPGSEYLRALWPALSGCALMAVAIQALKAFSPEPWPLYVRLASEITIGLVTYGSLWSCCIATTYM